MQQAFRRYKPYFFWVLLVCSLGFWFSTITYIELPSLSFITPFADLGVLFWVGLSISLIAFFEGNNYQKTAAVVIFGMYFIGTISFIFKYPVMHDSVINTAYSPTSYGSFELYGKTYFGMGIFLNLIQSIFGGDYFQIARFFPVGVGIVYLMVFGLFYYSWRGILFSSFFSFCLFALFIFAFGETFYLRINASPQTIAYLIFLLSLSLIPLASKNVWLKMLLLLSISLMIITHPISPLLSLPALGAAIILVDKRNKISLMHTIEFLTLVVVGYLAWTLFMGDWVIKQAFMVIRSALETEKIIPVINGITYITQVNNYILWHRILLITLLIVLFVLYLVIFKSKAWIFVTTWGIVLLPAFLLLLSYKDFFDRILLFGLIPCAIVFAEGSQKLITRFPKIKLPAAGLLVGLVLLSAYISYFFIGAVDRVTADEVEANKYISSIDIPLRVYTNGFNLPTPSNISIMQATRGIIDVNQAMDADVILISKQMENAAIINPRAPIQVGDFINLIQEDYILLQTFGDVKVYMKPPNELGVP